MKGNNNEYILCAALMHNDTIIPGYRHHSCYDLLKKLLNLSNDDDLPGRESHGFLTSRNRFVDRKEGYKIAKANNQLLLPPKQDDSDEILTSEDLYFYVDAGGMMR